MSSANAAIGLAEIEEAARRLANHAVRTPLIENAELNARLGLRLLVKAECLQVSGSFKFRGAYNRLSQLTQDERRRGVVAWSSGNHAQGVAYAAKLLGVPALIVMPEDAPKTKVAKTRAYGAEVIFYDRYTDDREAIGHRLVAERGATLVPSYDDPEIIAGQGTVGLEIVAQAREMGALPDAALICCGGGGLLAGTGTALRAAFPGIALHAVEPEGYDDTGLSLERGEMVVVDKTRRTICDALMTPYPGRLTLTINRALGVSGLTVSDDEVRRAMRVIFETFKLVAEPGGAAAVAAVLADSGRLRGQTVVVTLSGGNVDAALFCRIVHDQEAGQE
jgi:threonine dehydratase